MKLPKRNQLIPGMIFSNGDEYIQLLRRGTNNIWECYTPNNEDEYIRHDYIFTEHQHGFLLIAIIDKECNLIIGEIPNDFFPCQFD